MGILRAITETPVTVEASVVGLVAAGPAVALWEAAHRRDRAFGEALVETHSPEVVVSSGASLAAHLLRRAGALLTVTDLPPWQIDPVEAAANTLRSVTAGTPASSPLAQFAAQFAEDPARQTVRLVEVTVQGVIVLAEAAACLASRKSGSSVASILGGVQACLVLDAA